jgi:hypothetical protein
MWRKTSRLLKEASDELAALEAESFPALAAICGAALATGAPELIGSLHDQLLRWAMRQAEAEEAVPYRSERFASEPPLGMLPNGELNVVAFVPPRR